MLVDNNNNNNKGNDNNDVDDHDDDGDNDDVKVTRTITISKTMNQLNMLCNVLLPVDAERLLLFLDNLTSKTALLTSS